MDVLEKFGGQMSPHHKTVKAIKLADHRTLRATGTAAAPRSEKSSRGRASSRTLTSRSGVAGALAARGKPVPFTLNAYLHNGT